MEEKDLVEKLTEMKIANEEEYESVLSKYDEKYALIQIGGKTTVYRKTDGYQQSWRDADVYFMNDKMTIRSLDKDGNIKEETKRAFPYWLENTTERYEGITYNPSEQPGPLHNKWNTWCGWAYEPSNEGSCDLYLDHIYHNICNENNEHYNYILDWMAQIIQQPTIKTNHALSIKGDQGSGKTVFVNHFMSLFGDSAEEISDSSILTENFNSILANKLLIYGDEAFWSGDKKNRGKLKNLISSYTVRITYKRKDTITLPNYMRFIFTTNNDWAAPVENGERRWVTFRCGNRNLKDGVYFSKMEEEMKNGGYEKLMWILVNRDISQRDWTQASETEAMREDKAFTEIYDNPLYNYLEDCLSGMKEHNFFDLYDHGEGIDNKTYGKGVPSGRFIEMFSGYCKSRGYNIRVNNTNVGLYIKKIFGDDIPKSNSGNVSIQTKVNGKNTRVYYLGEREEIESILEDYRNI